MQLKIAFRGELQSGPPINRNQHKRKKQFTFIPHTNSWRAYPAIWLKVPSHQIANYNKCVITVIAFKMDGPPPECAVTLAHLIKPISMSVMFASQLVITQTESLLFRLAAGPFIWHLKPHCRWRFMFYLGVFLNNKPRLNEYNNLHLITLILIHKACLSLPNEALIWRR